MDLVILSAIVLGLTEVVKRTLALKKRWIPLTALITTFVLVSVFVLVNHYSYSWDMIMKGLIVALSLVGLYSGVKNTLNK